MVEAFEMQDPARPLGTSGWPPLCPDTVQDSANLVSLCFLRWHRFAQSAHIAKAHAELQSSDNLVNFLSSTLLGEMRPWFGH